MNRKMKTGMVAVGAVCVSGIAVWAASGLYSGQKAAEQVLTEAYQTDTVQRGNVSVGISENGTVEFGTKEQTFSVAEITEVSSADTENSENAAADSTEGTDAMQMSGMMASAGEDLMGGTADLTSSGIGSSGVTGASSSEEETSLLVEEIYAAVGQSVKKGEKVLKIKDDSIEEYREALEEAVASAQLKVSKEEINAETKKAEADYTYAMYLAEGETAQETYEATLTELDKAVSELEEELQEAQDDGDEDEIEDLEAQLQIAKNNRSTQSIEAKQTYENAMTNYKYAEQLYAIDTEGLEDELDEAKEALKEAQENLEQFETEIGDGIVYAAYSGTITEISCAEGEALANGGTVVIFTDEDNVTMTVSVSQDDISKISVGETADISLTAYEDQSFSGEVASVSTSSTSGTSTVNYEVSVRFTGDISAVYSGMTGDVTFAVRSEEGTLYIPNRAVYQEGAASMVKVLEEDGSEREIEIKTGFSDGTVVAVESGLEEGQTVVIESRVSE